MMSPLIIKISQAVTSVLDLSKNLTFSVIASFGQKIRDMFILNQQIEQVKPSLRKVRIIEPHDNFRFMTGFESFNILEINNLNTSELTEIEELLIDITDHSDTIVQLINKLPNLKKLRFNKDNKIDVRDLAAMNKLDLLLIWYSSLGWHDLAVLANKAPQLKWLCLPCSNLSDMDIDDLNNPLNIEVLNICESKTSEINVNKILKTCTKLREFDISGIPLLNLHVDDIGTLPHLEKLNISTHNRDLSALTLAKLIKKSPNLKACERNLLFECLNSFYSHHPAIAYIANRIVDKYSKDLTENEIKQLSNSKCSDSCKFKFFTKLVNENPKSAILASEFETYAIKRIFLETNTRYSANYAVTSNNVIAGAFCTFLSFMYADPIANPIVNLREHQSVINKLNDQEIHELFKFLVAYNMIGHRFSNEELQDMAIIRQHLSLLDSYSTYIVTDRFIDTFRATIDLNDISFIRHAPITLAVKEHRLDIILILLKINCNVNIQSIYSRPLVDDIAPEIQGKSPVYRMLNERRHDTALHIALEMESNDITTQIIVLLLQNGAKYDIPNSDDITAADVAKSKGIDLKAFIPAESNAVTLVNSKMKMM